MGYTLERLDVPAAYLLSFDVGFDIQNEMKALNIDLIDKLDNDVAESLVIIAEIDNLHLSLSNIMNGTKETLDSGFNPNHHPKVTKTIIISDNGLLKMSLGGLGKLGLLKDAQVVGSLDAALALAKQV